MAKNENKNDNKVKKNFFKDFKAELKKVIWPTPKQLLNNTSAVVAIVLISAVLVFVLDIAFEFGNKEIVYNLQSVVNDKYNGEENANTENTENNSTETNSEQSTSTEQEDSTTTKEENAETSENGDQTNTEQ